MSSANSPSKVYELAGLKTARWPGDPKGLDVNSPYQFIEYETLLEDEYDEYMDTPIEFAISKFLPRTAEVFDPLQSIDWFGAKNHRLCGCFHNTSHAGNVQEIRADC